MSNSFLCVTSWTVTCQALLFTGFSRQEYWSGFPFLPPGDLPDPEMEPASPALKADSLPLSNVGIHLQRRRLGFDPLQEEMATHSSILAWKIL